MPPMLPPIHAQPYRRAAIIAAGLAAALSAWVLAGWVLSVPTMASVAPDAVTMKPNTAICFLLLAVAVGLQARERAPRTARGAALAAGTLAGAVLSQWIFGIDLGIDELLFPEAAGAVGTPAGGRMAPNTSVCAMLLALAVALDGSRWRSSNVASVAAVAAMTTAVAALTGYAMGIPTLFGIPQVTHMAVPTATVICLLASGALLSRPSTGVMALLTSRAVGGHLLRRLLPVVIGVPLGADLVRVGLVDAGVMAHEVSDWLFLVVVTTVMVTVTVRLARTLERAHRRRLAGERRVQESEAVARGVIDAANAAILGSDGTGTITLFNPAAERMFGRSSEQAVGGSVLDLVPARLHGTHRRWLAAQRRGATTLAEGRTIDLVGLTSDGKELDLECSFTAVRRDDAEIEFIAILHDMTARNQLEQRTRTDAERLARVVEAQGAIGATTGGVAAVMAVVADRACAIVGADGAVVELPEGDELVYRAAVGSVAAHLGTRIGMATSLSGAALRAGTTLHCVDAEHDPRVDRELLRTVRAGSMICVPLRHRNGVIGVLKVLADEPHAFTAGDERTLELLAGLGGAAVHRAQDDRELAAHHTVASALAEAQTQQAGVATALRGLAEILGWDVATLWLAPEDGDALRCEEFWQAASVPAAPYARACGDATPRLGDGVLGEVWRTGRPVWSDDIVSSVPHPADEARIAAAVESGLTTIVDVAVVANGEALGVLQLGARDRRAERPESEALLLIVAGQVGQFVQRKRAQGQVAAQAANLAAVVELTQSVVRLRDPARVRPALSAAVRDITGADQVVIFEPDGPGRLLATAQTGDHVPDGVVLELDRPSAAGAAFLAARGHYVDDSATDMSVVRALAESSGLRSAYLEPLMRDGEAVGVVSISWHTRRRADPAELRSLVQLLVAETANALERADLVAALDAAARTDQLTGVANRRAWDEQLPRETARAGRTASPLCVALIDLDHFKAFNDTHGHQGGDRLLREASAALAGRLRATDVISRYGGEEFAVLLPGCHEAVAGAVLDDLRRAMPQGATCSIGAAQWNGTESPDALVARADAALYEAKRAGRDRVVVSDDRARTAA